MFEGSGLTSEANVAFDEHHDFADSWRGAVHHRRSPSSYLLQRHGRAWDLLTIACALRDRHFLPVTRQLARFES
jgi:hypothetical protein